MRAKGEQEHSLLDLYSKAKLAREDQRLVHIAMLADTPNSAEETAKRQKFGKAKRIATAAFVRLRNEYKSDFWEMPEVIKCFKGRRVFVQNKILAELPEKIRTALEATRERKVINETNL